MEQIKTEFSKTCGVFNRTCYYKNKNSLDSSLKKNKTCLWCKKDSWSQQNKDRKNPLNKCEICQKETKNPKFCSNKCYITTNVKKVEIKCRDCNKLISLGWSGKKLCEDCKIPESYKKTLKELRKQYGTFQFNAKVRGLARSNYFKYNKKNEVKCAICGYKLHVDVCHIKPVKDFSEDCFLSEVNDIKNLTALCKNHHWEFDNGHIKLV